MFRVQVTFRDMAISETLEARCWEEVSALRERCEDIRSCQVTISAPRSEEADRDSFDAAVSLRLPISTVRADRAIDVKASNRDALRAIADGFRLAEQRLRRTMRTERGDEAGESSRETRPDGTP